MFYSLTILTLLASILFYSFYPRNDGIKNVDMPAAKAYVTEFVAHHMAAVEAARAISYDSTAGKNKMAYESWIPNSQIDIANYVNYMPPNTPENVLNDRIANPTLYCFDNANGSQSNCAQRTANTADSNFGLNLPGRGNNFVGTVFCRERQRRKQGQKEKCNSFHIFGILNIL